MTLVIAGHSFVPERSYWVTENVPPKHRLDGLFFAADGAITNERNVTLLGGFRKIYPMTAMVWKPYFVGEYFRSYREVQEETPCAVAFSGSTLTAQHIFNYISAHIDKLRISYRDSGILQPGKYVVIKHCEPNPLEAPEPTLWDEDMFTPNDLAGLLTAEVVVDAIEHAIDSALTSARKYKLDEQAFRSMYTEFAVAVYCPVQRKSRLFTFRTESYQDNDGLLAVRAKREEVHEGSIAVLGMRNEFEARAQAAFAAAVASVGDTQKVMFDFLNAAIDEVKAGGHWQIDRPSVLKNFNQKGLEVVDRRFDD